MVSPELIRRYPFFADLNHEYLVSLAEAADEQIVATGYHFFREGDQLEFFYLVIEGAVSINISATDPDIKQEISGQLTGALEMKDITVSTIGTGNVFGWSALIPPTNASASATAVTPCRVIAFNCEILLGKFEEDQHFGYLMTQKAAHVVRSRLRDMRIESLAFVS